MLPTLFLSHGSPMLAVEDIPARRFLLNLGAAIEAEHGRPSAILIASAHWETEHPAVNAVAWNDTIHDFYGFPQALYRLRYPAPGDAALADRAGALLEAAGMAWERDTQRGLDHGAWVPLLMAWPAADIPVVALSVQSHLSPAHHLRVGQALAPLREQGVLIIGSGAMTHDLRRMRSADPNGPEAPDVAAFTGWMSQALTEGRTDDLLAYRDRAPYGKAQHPTPEHLLPLFVALGAGGGAARQLHESVRYGFLRMDAWGFGG